MRRKEVENKYPNTTSAEGRAQVWRTLLLEKKAKLAQLKNTRVLQDLDPQAPDVVNRKTYNRYESPLNIDFQYQSIEIGKGLSHYSVEVQHLHDVVLTVLLSHSFSGGIM